MKIYVVVNRDENYSDEFYSLVDAKRAMKEHNAKGYIYKFYSNGSMVQCGEIKLSNSNKTFAANSRQKGKGY